MSADVDAWRAIQAGRAYEDMAIPLSEVVRHAFPWAGNLGHAVVDGWRTGRLIRNYRTAEAEDRWPFPGPR